MSNGRLSEFLHSFGPAWVVMIADVDAASVLTAAEDGAVYGYGLIWFLLLLIIPLGVNRKGLLCALCTQQRGLSTSALNPMKAL